MRVSRIKFDDSEPTESIVRRIACAFDPGNIVKIRDSFFKMSNQRVMNQTVASNVIEDRYTLILNPGEPIPEGLLKAEVTPLPPVIVQKPELEEADWDDDSPVEAVVVSEPVTEPIATEPISVPVESELVAENDLLPEEVSEPAARIDIDFCKLAALSPELPRHDVAEAISAPPPPDSVPPPPTSEVFMSRPPPSIDGKPLTVSKSTSESGEYKIEIPKSRTNIEPGQVWQSKDTRRNSPPFVVKNVDNEFVYPDNGKRISLNRMIRYKRVS